MQERAAWKMDSGDDSERYDGDGGGGEGDSDDAGGGLGAEDGDEHE